MYQRRGLLRDQLETAGVQGVEHCGARSVSIGPKVEGWAKLGVPLVPFNLLSCKTVFFCFCQNPVLVSGS